MSPILVRPVREQLEHDRVIRLLQAKYKRKFEVAINPGHEQTVPVTVGLSPWYPDLVLQSTGRGRRLLGTVEVETAESVNNLEAMSQWATFGRLRAPFHLYIPASSIDTAKRLCVDLEIAVAEIWAFSSLGDQMRFTLVQRSAADKGRAASAPRAPAKPKRPAAPSRTQPRRIVASPVARPVKRGAGKKSAARATGTRKKASRSSRAQKRK
ncbi:MAG: hypothetical protein EXQ53_13035 [Acidobacteria bacterium]|nr:hypothetical protein [Acidobacteriota bacterium]